MNIEEAKAILERELEFDDEAYHVAFDIIIEARLKELDPKFMKAMTKLYKDSGMSRWYA